MLQLRIYLVLLYFFCLFIEHLICSCVMFLNSYHCLSMFSCSSLSLLGQLFCCFGILWISISLGVGYWSLLAGSFGGVIFPWLFDVSCFLALVSVQNLKKQVTFSILIKKVPLSVGVDVSSRLGERPVVQQLRSTSGYEAMRAGGVLNSTSRSVVSILGRQG